MEPIQQPVPPAVFLDLHPHGGWIFQYSSDLFASHPSGQSDVGIPKDFFFFDIVGTTELQAQILDD